jgi:uncharacterized damage-inducible protein DinB
MAERLTPEDAGTLMRLWTSAFLQERRFTHRVIAAIPDAAADYRPSPVSMTAIDLAWHIVAAEEMFLQAIVEGRFEPLGGRPDALALPRDIAGFYTLRFAEGLRRIRDLDGERLARPLVFRNRFERPAVMFLQTAMNHSIHHRGQLTVYLRGMGAAVPATYGDSHDERAPV